MKQYLKFYRELKFSEKCEILFSFLYRCRTYCSDTETLPIHIQHRRDFLIKIPKYEMICLHNFALK